MAVLPKRFGKYGLTLHPEKTRLLKFVRPPWDPPPGGADGGSDTFDFLGFTHYWARSRAGRPVVKRRTAKDRFSRALRRVKEWCRYHRHDPLRVQQQGLARKLRGHYAYFAVTANNDAIARFSYEVKQTWWKWLSRRSHRPFPWPRMAALLERLPLPEPRIVHRYGT